MEGATFGRQNKESPIQLALEGAEDSYRLIVNEEYLGEFPIDVLRSGIELPL